MDVHFTGFLFDFFGLILADTKAAFFRRTPRDRRERGLPLRLIQVVFSDAAYGFLWRKNGFAKQSALFLAPPFTTNIYGFAFSERNAHTF